MTVIVTDRLLLRWSRGSDPEPFARMNADPRVMEFYPACLSRKESDVTRSGGLPPNSGWQRRPPIVSRRTSSGTASDCSRANCGMEVGRRILGPRTRHRGEAERSRIVHGPREYEIASGDGKNRHAARCRGRFRSSETAGGAPVAPARTLSSDRSR